MNSSPNKNKSPDHMQNERASLPKSLPHNTKRNYKQTHSTQKAIVVLGMHRSGTSALSGVLNILGCHSPKTQIPADSSNAAGYWESLPISRFNDRLLASGGSLWHDWHQFNNEWQDSAIATAYIDEAIKILAEEYGTAPLIQIKDPRMCLLMPFWRIVFKNAGITPYCIIIQRNPTEVAASLSKRDDFSQAKGLLLWLRYMLDAERYSRGLPRSFTSYDEVLSDFRNLPSKLETQLGIKWPRKSERVFGEIANFLSGGLRNHQAAGARFVAPSYLAPWMGQVFTTLDDWGRNGEDASKQSLMDQVCRNLESSEVPFSRIVREMDNYFRENIKLERVRKNFETISSENEQAKQLLSAQSEENRKIASEALIYQNEIQELKTNIKELHENLLSTQESSNKIIASMASEYKQAKQLLSAQSEENRKIVSEALMYQQEAKELQNNVKEFELKYKSLEEKHLNEIILLTASCKERDEKIAELSAIAQKNSSEIDNLHAQLEAEVINFKELNWKFDQTNSELRQRQHECEETKSEYDKSKKLLENLLEENKALDLENNIKKSEHESLINKISSIKLEAQRDIEDRFKEVATLTHILENNEKNLNETIAQFRKLNSAYDEMLHNGDVTFQHITDALRILLKSVEKPWRSPKRVLQLKTELLQKLGLFDSAWYNSANNDVRESGMEPAFHYINHGLEERRSPLPDFNRFKRK